MRISALVRECLGLGYMDDELLLLERLAGRQIAHTRFYADASWIENGQTASYFLARYFLPVADCTEWMLGIHLLPSHITQGRFVLAQFDPESNRLIEVAHSWPAYFHRALLEAESEGDSIESDLRAVREVCGADFYCEPYGALSADQIEQIMIAEYGGAAVDYRDLALAAKLHKAADEQFEWLKQGAVAAPGNLYFHWELAQLHLQRGDYVAAARSFVNSLACYHHTAYGSCGEDYYQVGRELLELSPTLFSDIARYDVLLADAEARLRWVASLFQHGATATALKLLSDFRYDSGMDLHPLLLQLLRLHYAELGWTWALAWCDLCAVDDNSDTRRYQYRGQPLAENWAAPIRVILGLPCCGATGL